MEPMKQQDIEQMEKEAQQELGVLSGQDDKKREALSGIAEELSALYANGKEWMKTNMDPEVMEPRIQKLKAETELLLSKAKTKVQTFTEKPEVREKLSEGKEVVAGASAKVAHAVSEGAQEFLQQEPVKKVVDNVSQKIDAFANDERVKEGVSSLKKGTLKVAESAFNGLKKILDDDATDGEQ